MKRNRRQLLKKITLGAAWTTPIAHCVALPAHASTSPEPTSTTTAIPSSIIFNATINAQNEVPPTTSTDTGTAVLVYNIETAEYTFNVTSTMSDTDFLSAHIHPGAPGVEGSPIVVLSSAFSAGNINFSGTFPAAYVSDLLAGNTYVNLHTNAEPGGAIRGQLVPV